MRNLVSIKDNPLVKIVSNIYDYLNPEFIYLPILDDTSIPSYIYKNTYLENHFSSISGTPSGYAYFNYLGKKIKIVKIKNDFKENSEVKKRKKSIHNQEELIDLLNKYHLSNLITKIENKEIKNLVINGIDEEIYSAKELMRLKNNYNEILEMTNELLKILNLEKALVVTKNTNAESIQNLKSIIGTYPNITIKLTPDKYLISYPIFLCEYLNLAKEDTLILTANEIYDLYMVVFKSKDIIEKLITISGDAILKSLVINTRLYVSLEELVNKFITITLDENDYDIYLNGYLMGTKVLNIKDVIISPSVDTIVFKKREEPLKEECINCGACQKVCPFNINVKKCYFNKLRHKNCIGCGLCNYICPANLELKEIVWRDKNGKENN